MRTFSARTIVQACSAALPADDNAIVVAVVAARLLLPLLIPRCPLVILAALILEGLDNSVLDRFTGVD